MDLNDADLEQLSELIAELSTHRSTSSRPPGHQEVRLNWWVKERQEWWGRVRGANGRQRWMTAVDLRPAKGW